MRQDIISRDKSEIDILNSARLGTEEYDFDSIQKVKEEAKTILFEIKSKIDGKYYIAKKL